MRASIGEQSQTGAAAPEAQIAIESDEDITEALASLLEFVDGFSLPFFSEQRNENLRLVMRNQAASNFDEIRSDPTAFFYDSLDYITFFILLMLPIQALIQKLLYIRSRRFYVEHLILTLHNHAFLILAIFIANIASLVESLGIAGVALIMRLTGHAITIWIFVYLFLSLRIFFGQSYFITLCKFITMAVIYAVVTAIGIFYFAVILFFLF